FAPSSQRLVPLLPPGTPTNIVNVATAIDNFIGSGGTLPPFFGNLFNLSGTQLANTLAVLDGEVAADASKGAFSLMTSFLELLLDEYGDGRGGGAGGAIGFAAEQSPSLPPEIALAYASVLKAPPAPASFQQRWSVWGAGFGGTNRT